MISEEQIELLTERLVERINKANIYFYKKIGNAIKQMKELTPSQAHKLAQMLKYGGDYEEIVKQISKYTNLNIQDIDQIFSSYAKKDQLFYEKFYKYRNIPFVPFNENTALKMQTRAFANMVKKEIISYSREKLIGFTINGEFRNLKDTYYYLIDEAVLNVSQGKETFDSSMRRILKDIGESGLKTVNYQSGRSVRLDSTVRMQLKSKLRELHNEMQEIYGKEFGADGVEISTHSHPAPDHLVQGHQFSNEEFAKLQNGNVARDYKGRIFTLDHDSNGSYRPISEMNCYHYIFPIVLGVSKPTYSDEELKKIIDENNDGFNFEGKHYTLYDGEQLLRNIELNLRKNKDIQILGRASDNAELVGETQTKITQLTTKYHEILKASGLRSKLDRARVAGYHRVSVEKMKKK